MTKRIKEYAIALFIFAISSFFFLTESPLHPWINGTSAIDSSVFRTVAMVMRNGGMPYKDTFDHKGPLLYIIDYFGDLLSPSRGIWVFEFLFLIITLFALYKTARLFCDEVLSFVVVYFSAALLFAYFGYGNLVEEYAMPFIAIGQYIFIDYLVNDVISKGRLIVCGFSLAAILMLRPNMIGLWIVMCLLILGELILAKDFRLLGEFSLWFIIGMAILILPIIIWLAAGGALNDFWQDYIDFNFLYSANAGAASGGKISSFFTFAGSSVYTTAMIITCFLIKNDKRVNISYLIYMLLSVVLVAMAGLQNFHYGMVLVPVVCYPMAALFEQIKLHFSLDKAKLISVLLSIYLCTGFIVPNWMQLMTNVGSIYDERNDSHMDSTLATVASMINEACDESDTISVYGNWDAVYLASNRFPASKYSYQFPIGQVDSTIMDEYFEELAENKPKLIVIEAGRYDEAISIFMGDNGYKQYYTNSGEDMQGIFIYMLEEDGQ